MRRRIPAGTKGFLNGVELSKVSEFEAATLVNGRSSNGGAISSWGAR